MGQMTGMDIEEVRRLAKAMREASKEVEKRAKDVNGKLHGVHWNGKDRNKFQQEWDGRIRKDLENAAKQLEEYGKKAEQQAKEQEQASAK